jgi:hypothetical protein
VEKRSQYLSTTNIFQSGRNIWGINSQILLLFGTSKALIACTFSSTVGGTHDPGSGLKLSFRSLGEWEPTGDLPLSGDSVSTEVTLCNSDMPLSILC